MNDSGGTQDPKGQSLTELISCLWNFMASHYALLLMHDVRLYVRQEGKVSSWTGERSYDTLVMAKPNASNPIVPIAFPDSPFIRRCKNCHR